MTEVYVIAEVYGGVLNEISVFSTIEKALFELERQAKSYDFKQVAKDHWTSQDEDDDMTLWTVKID
jgi:hypothetical protein